MSRARSKNQPNTEQLTSVLIQNGELRERLAALELALESETWRSLSHQSEQEFSREGLRIITDLARVMALKSPLIKRGIEVKRLYVWAQGMSIKVADPALNDVIEAFNDDRQNQAELTSHVARAQKEVELQTDGNLFFVFFINPVTGRVRVRSISFDEIEDIVCNPQDAKETWFYKRVWHETGLTGEIVARSAYYPDWQHTPTKKVTTLNNVAVRWDTPVYHIKVGNFSNWKFGLSEIYAGIDWARAYKEFLEDWASIVRAYRKFAFQLTTPGGKSTIAAAKSKLSTTLGMAGSESNPPPVTGSTFISSEGYNLQPIRTSGATVGAEDGRRIMLMAAAAAGLPETFYGDTTTGSLATAQSLDRPTELMMLDRQTMWKGVFQAIYDFVLLWAAKASGGPLRGKGRILREIDGEQVIETVKWGAGVDPHLDIDFPPILQRDIDASVNAVVRAATLDGKQLAGTLDMTTVARMLLLALGEDDVDEIINRLFPEGETAAPPAPEPATDRAPEPATEPAPERPTSESMMIEAVKELRASLLRLKEAGS